MACFRISYTDFKFVLKALPTLQSGLGYTARTGTQQNFFNKPCITCQANKT